MSKRRYTDKKSAKRWYTVRLTYPMSDDFAAIDRKLYKADGGYSNESGAGTHRDHGWGAESASEARTIANRIALLGVPGLKVRVESGLGDGLADQIVRVRGRKVVKRSRAVKKGRKPTRRNWVSKAFSKNKGALHRALRVPEGQTIPVSKLRAAVKRGGKIGKRAQLVLNMRSARLRKKRSQDAFLKERMREAGVKKMSLAEARRLSKKLDRYGTKF